MSVAVLTFAEVCETLRISDKTLRGILNRRELPGVKVGATWRVRSDDLEAYLCPSTSVATSGTTTPNSREPDSAEQPKRRSRGRPPRFSLTGEKKPSEPSSWERVLDRKSTRSGKPRTSGSQPR